MKTTMPDANVAVANMRRYTRLNVNPGTIFISFIQRRLHREDIETELDESSGPISQAMTNNAASPVNKSIPLIT